MDKFYFKSHIVKTYNISSNELVQATYKINNKYKYVSITYFRTS